MSIGARHGFKAGRTAVSREDYWIDFIHLPDHLGPFGAGQSLADEKPQDFLGEDSGET
jgi:hypothetical protein